MANISDVEGVMTLEGEWTPEMISDLNTIAKEWEKWYYNIDIFDEFATSSLSSRFCANGRWSFDSNLSWCGKALRESEDEAVVAVYNRLCEELKTRVDEYGEPTTYIEVQFEEHESGCGILRSAEAVISIVNGELEGIVTNEENHDYTKENLVELGFYDNEDDIDWLDEEEEYCEHEWHFQSEGKEVCDLCLATRDIASDECQFGGDIEDCENCANCGSCSSTNRQ